MKENFKTIHTYMPGSMEDQNDVTELYSSTVFLLTNKGFTNNQICFSVSLLHQSILIDMFLEAFQFLGIKASLKE